MDRREEIIKLQCEICVDEYVKARNDYIKLIKKHNKEIFDSFYNIFRKVFNKVVLLQEEGRKGAVYYIYLSKLNSDVILNRYGYQIDIFNEEFYLDDEEVYDYLDMSYVFCGIDEAMERIERDLKKKILRVKEYEIFELKQLLINDYYIICQETITKLIPYINKIDEYKKMKKGNVVKVLIGGYMDEFKVLHEFVEE